MGSLPAAGRAGNVDRIRLCLRNGANVDEKDADGNSALMYAVYHGRLASVLLLIENKANLNITNNGGATQRVSGMQHREFIIGGIFSCAGKQWRCTDIGTRTIIAIRIDQVEVGSLSPEPRMLSRAEAEAEGWFNGPPYAVAEIVFDDDLDRCSLAPDSDDAAPPGTIIMTERVPIAYPDTLLS